MGCWYDLFQAIQNAQKFIYITGWSVYTEIQLVRGEDDPEGLSNVGNLLKSKAEEGVRVILLVWNEKLSTDVLPGGFMGTHDEDTRQFFKDTLGDWTSRVEDMTLPNFLFSEPSRHYMKEIF